MEFLKNYCFFRGVPRGFLDARKPSPNKSRTIWQCICTMIPVWKPQHIHYGYVSDLYTAVKIVIEVTAVFYPFMIQPAIRYESVLTSRTRNHARHAQFSTTVGNTLILY